MKNISKAGLGMVGALALILLQGTVANADVQPQAGDVVGVGSDTVQFGMDFLADGDVSGHTGFNTTNQSRRVVNFDATGDACGSATTNAVAVLRANSKPVTRPNGSGAGITALNADTGSTEVINYVRSSRLPTPAEQATATPAWGGLHVYQFATDGLKMAVSNSVTTHAPATLDLAVLVNIYQGTYLKWGDIPGYTGSAPTATIHPLLPQSGSGTRNFFLADLQAQNGGTAIVLGSNVLAMQENDPTLIENDADAIGPFSVGRASVLNAGYCGPASTNVIKLLSAGDTYSTSRGLYIIVRQRDVTDTTGAFGIPFPWQTGGTKNWVQTLFVGTLSLIGRSSNAPLIASAGLVPGYQDLGLAHS
jgi:ABC-type phosphate transport system substrate-binding protein